MINLKFLYQPSTVKKIRFGAAAILIITIFAEFFIKMHAYFSIADFFSFNVVYGFIVCTLMIVVVKLLGYFIKRRDDYYDV